MTTRQIAGVLFAVAAILFALASRDWPEQRRLFTLGVAFTAAALAVQALA